MAHKKFIFGNWKMAQSLSGVQSFIDQWSVKVSPQIEVAIFPSYIHLSLAAKEIEEQKKPLSLGAQDCSAEEKGAFTGEISAAMIKEIGCQYTLIGHSERRQRAPENDTTLAQKLSQAARSGLTPVYCLGETEDERNAGKLLEVVNRQAAVMKGYSGNFLVAYEPVWAIGTGKVATEKDIEVAHAALREIFPTTALLYGGSVNSGNSAGILKGKNVDGLLVGGASLKVEEFQKIALSA